MAFDPSNFTLTPELAQALAAISGVDANGTPVGLDKLIDIPDSGGWAIGPLYVGGQTEGGQYWQQVGYEVYSRDPNISKVGGYYYSAQIIGNTVRGVREPIINGGALDGIEMLVLLAIAGGALFEMGTFGSLFGSAAPTEATTATTVSTSATTATDATASGFADAQANLDAWSAQIDPAWSAQTQAVTNGQFSSMVGVDSATQNAVNQAVSQVTGSTAPDQVLTAAQATQASSAAASASFSLVDPALKAAAGLASTLLATYAKHQQASGGTVALPVNRNLPGTQPGAVTRQPDGSFTIRNPDGTLTTIAPDGTTTQQQPNQLPGGISPLMIAGGLAVVAALLSH